jgi:chromosome segregation ATPase
MQTHAMAPEVIQGQINALLDKLAEYDERATDLALGATEGNAEAARDIAKLNDEIRAMRADLDILRRASRASDDRAQRNHAQARARARDAHLARARQQAADLLAIADQIDRITEDFVIAIDALKRTQGDLRRSIHDAGEKLDNGHAGRGDIDIRARARMTRAVTGRRGGICDKPISAVVQSAWREFLEETENG